MFVPKALQLDKFEGGDLKFDNSFLKFLPKNTQIRRFFLKLRHFCFFKKFCNLTNLTVLFQIWQRFFKILAQKYPNNPFLVPNLRLLFFFWKILQIDKFQGVDFKYDNSLWKFSLEKTQIRHFWFGTLAF